jgi:acyl carrier protein
MATNSGQPSPAQQLVLQQLRRQVLNLDENPDPSLSLRDDAGLDSLELVEFVMSLEQTLHLELPDAEIGGWRTLEDVYTSVERHTAH